MRRRVTEAIVCVSLSLSLSLSLSVCLSLSLCSPPRLHTWPQEDGVNDVGPMISEQVIARCEILRPDSALIPANEAEKPRYTHTHTLHTAHTAHTAHTLHTCLSTAMSSCVALQGLICGRGRRRRCLPVRWSSHALQKRERAGLLGTIIDKAPFLHAGGCSSARRLPGRAGAEGGLTMARKSLHGCSKSGSRVRAGAGAGAMWGGDELRRGRGAWVGF